MPCINRIELEFVAHGLNSADFRKGSAAAWMLEDRINKKARTFPGFFMRLAGSGHGLDGGG